MTHLPYSTTHPKPGSTITAAQANALPVGSEIEWLTGPRKERMALSRDGKWRWLTPPVGEIVNHDGQLGAEFTYTLIRVGPAAFAVGDVVTAAQCNELPDGAVVDDNGAGPAIRREKRNGEWFYFGETTATPMLSVWTYTIVSLPHSSHAAESPANPNVPGTLAWARWAAQHEGVCVKSPDFYPYRFADSWQFWNGELSKWIEPSDIAIAAITKDPGPWSIVPDPSAAETPVETSDETPVLHIDPTAITVELDKAIPQWREESWTVAQAIRVLRQRYEMQMQVCMYQGDSAAASAKYTKRLEEQVATLTAERDAAISEIGKSCAIMAKSHAEEVKGLTTERDAAIQRAEKAEMLLVHRHTAWQAAAQVVVPQDVLDRAKKVASHPQFFSAEAVETYRFILSLADHIVDANKMVQSTHPEGSREWAEDAMRQGFSVTHQYADDVCWKDFACTDGRKWKGRGMADTGWRIHTPAVAPSPLPSVAQLAASIESLNERIHALEKGGA